MIGPFADALYIHVKGIVGWCVHVAGKNCGKAAPMGGALRLGCLRLLAKRGAKDANTPHTLSGFPGLGM